MNVHPPATEPVVLPFTKNTKPDSVNHPPRRLPLMGWLPTDIKKQLVGFLGEFCGTFLFLFFAFSATQIANMSAGPTTAFRLPDPSDGEPDPLRPAARGQNYARADAWEIPRPNPMVLLYISLAFGFSLAVNAWVFFRISGGLFNPAVTLALCLIGAVSWLRGIIVVVAQILGAIAAAAAVSGIFPGSLLVRTSLLPGTSKVRGVFIELFLTAQLILTM